MAALQVTRSKVPIASDVVFGYTLVSIVSGYPLQTGSIEQLPSFLVTGTIFSSVLGLLQPVEKALGFWVNRASTIRQESLVREAFYSSFLDSSRSKAKASLDLAMILIVLTFLPPYVEPIELWLVTLLPAAVIMVLVAGYEGLWLALRTHLVTAYIRLIDEASGKSDDEVMRVLPEIRQAFERRNWGEAARYMNILGFPEGYELTKSLFGLHRAFVEEIPSKQGKP